MANFNKVILVGNLTRDPQLSYLPSQTAVVEFGLAVNRRYRTQDGQQREETCFVDCQAYGKQAEIINQYTSKGRQLLVDGRLKLDTWEDQNGQRRSKHRVVVENFQFMDSGGGQGGGQGGGSRGPQQRGGYQNQGPSPQGGPQGGAPSDGDSGYDDSSYGPPEGDTPSGEDIPF